MLPHEVYYMPKSNRSSFFAEKKASATAGNSSPSLLHVKTSQKRFWGQNKNTCGRRQDLTNLKICPKILGSLAETTPLGQDGHQNSTPQGGRPEKMNPPHWADFLISPPQDNIDT